jgi:hypothetical protein
MIEGMRRRWIVALASLAVAGCGSDPQLGAGAAGELRSDVDAVRAAAGEGDRAGALRALDRLAGRIDRAEADGELAACDASALRQGVRRAKRQAEREVPEPAPEATPEPTATPEPVPTAEPGKKPKPPKGESRGKGHGRDGDDEGDDD